MKKLVLKLINFYQKRISPCSSKKCRFIPTCSEYAKICFERFNIFYASFLTIKRLLKCNPFFEIGYDPVPEKKGRGIDPIAINNYLKVSLPDDISIWDIFFKPLV